MVLRVSLPTIGMKGDHFTKYSYYIQYKYKYNLSLTALQAFMKRFT
ncbi:MAG: hypothetical protein ACR5LG_01300 [Sodalis sp. (in: enterobacteria)]